MRKRERSRESLWHVCSIVASMVCLYLMKEIGEGGERRREERI